VSTFPLPSSPYKGLAAFEDSAVDALFFFGRDRDSQIVAANLIASRLTVLFGPAGVGKTSVLRAGVAHRLRQETGADVRINSTWIGPATQPFAELERQQDTDLYLILDQFEEFFLYHENDRTFAPALAALQRREDLRVNVLIGIREDALALLDGFKAAIPNLLSNRLRLENLDHAAGEAAIRGPLERFNERVPADRRVQIEADLVHAVLDEVATGRVEVGPAGRGVVPVASDSDRIEAPYLQLVMSRLWEVEAERGSSTLRRSTLEELGGATRIVENHLERAMAELSPQQKDAAAAMYNFLVTPSGSKIAHRTSDLAGYAEIEEPAAAEVLQRLAAERIVRANSENGAGIRYEIYHDVLADAVLSWHARHESDRAIRMAERRRKRALVVAACSIAALVLVAGLAVFAFLERSNARTEERHAHAGELAAEANVQLGIDPRQALVLALRAARLDNAQPVQAALRDALRASAVLRVFPVPQPILARTESGRFALGDARGRVYLGFKTVGRLPRRITSVALSGHTVAAGAHDGSIGIFGPSSTLLHQMGAVTALALCPTALASGADNGTVRIWRRGTEHAKSLRVRGRVKALAFSRDQKLLLVTSHDRRARLFDVATGLLVRVFAHGGFVNVASFSPDGEKVVTGSQDHNARIWGARSGKPLYTLPGARGGITALGFSPDRRLLAVASSDAVVRVYSLATGIRQYLLIGHVNAVTDVSFSPNGKDIATSSSDSTIRVWTANIGQPLGVLHGHAAPVTHVFFTRPDRVVSSGADSSVRVWDAGTAPDLKVLVRQHTPFVSASRRPGEIDVADSDGRVHVLDSRGLRVVSVRRGAPRPATGPTTAQAGSLRAVASGNAITIRRDGRVVQELRDLSTSPAMSAADIRALRFSPDQKLIASVGDDHYLRVWEVATGKKLYAVVAHQGPVLDLAFSPDSRWIVTAGTISARVWDARQGTELLLLLGPTKPVHAVLFTANGATIVTAGRDGTIRTYRCLVCGSLPGLVRTGEARLAATELP
jgi:WD40 repeat protein